MPGRGQHTGGLAAGQLQASVVTVRRMSEGKWPVGPHFHSKGKVASGVVRGRDAAKSWPPQEISVGGRGSVFILCFYIIKHEDQPRDCLPLPWLGYLPSGVCFGPMGALEDAE